MLCYLAGPMDYCDPESTRGLRTEACALLEDRGFAVFDPTGAYKVAMTDPEAVMEMNNLAIDRSDAVLAVWPPEIMSVGTPYEIFLAHRRGKPVVVVGPTRSMQLAACGIPVFPMEGLVDGVELLSGMVELHPHPPVEPPGAARVAGAPLKYTADDPLFEPWRQFDGDAGFDLVVTEAVTIPSNGFADVPCGVCVELPSGTWGMLTGRSSTIRQRGLLVNQGIIDNGYRGEMFAAAWNLTGHDVRVEKGERIAQLIVLPLSTCGVERVEELSVSSRGTMGFGSTGT